MTVQRLGRDTTSVDDLAWTGIGFGDATADAMWSQLCGPLKTFALSEIAAGNTPANIIRNDARDIVVLSFQKPPAGPRPDGDTIKVHASFANGNYCYDGTACTYEHPASGHFLAFEDPEYVDAL